MKDLRLKTSLAKIIMEQLSVSHEDQGISAQPRALISGGSEVNGIRNGLRQGHAHALGLSNLAYRGLHSCTGQLSTPSELNITVHMCMSVSVLYIRGTVIILDL